MTSSVISGTALKTEVLDLEVFRGINPEDLRLFFADKASQRTFDKNEPIIREGEKTPGVYFHH